MALERLTYDRAAKAVTYRSDKSEGPTAGTETADPLEFLARVLVHIPDKGHVTTRYYDWYANRPRGTRGKAALLQRILEVEPLACPTCHGAMRIVAFITQASVIDQILTHRRTRAAHATHPGARSPPSTRAPASRGASRAPRTSDGSPTGSATHCPARRSCGAHGARVRSKARRRPPRGAGEVGDRAEGSTDSRPTPIEIPIPIGLPVCTPSPDGERVIVVGQDLPPRYRGDPTATACLLSLEGTAPAMVPVFLGNACNPKLKRTPYPSLLGSLHRKRGETRAGWVLVPHVMP